MVLQRVTLGTLFQGLKDYVEVKYCIHRTVLEKGGCVSNCKEELAGRETDVLTA